jgi:hypothetical protein
MPANEATQAAAIAKPAAVLIIIISPSQNLLI